MNTLFLILDQVAIKARKSSPEALRPIRGAKVMSKASRWMGGDMEQTE